MVTASAAGDVKAAMSDFPADGVSEEYRGKELRWNRAAAEVRGIIGLLRSALEMNDDTAQSMLVTAKATVNNIG
jgi:hypothetical protein